MVGRRRDADDELMVRGSLFVKRRRCGKPNCRCAAGELHASPALTYRVDGRPRTLVLSEGDLAEVTAALARYKAARDALDARADAGIAALAGRVAARRQGRR